MIAVLTDYLPGLLQVILAEVRNWLPLHYLLIHLFLSHFRVAVPSEISPEDRLRLFSINGHLRLGSRLNRVYFFLVICYVLILMLSLVHLLQLGAVDPCSDGHLHLFERHPLHALHDLKALDSLLSDGCDDFSVLRRDFGHLLSIPSVLIL